METGGDGEGGVLHALQVGKARWLRLRGTNGFHVSMLSDLQKQEFFCTECWNIFDILRTSIWHLFRKEWSECAIYPHLWVVFCYNSSY